MLNKLILLFAPIILISCDDNVKTNKDAGGLGGISAFSDYYQQPETRSVFSKYVQDSFSIVKSLPKGYSENKKYPLIIVLDANTLYEPLLAELKFNTFTGFVPRSIVVGVGYKNFRAMDSLRSRDYTFPAALPEYEMAVSGGAEKFKAFIDQELLPLLTSEYSNIDLERSVLCGHSLGGYFTLFYFLRSAAEHNFRIRNVVSASPELFYNNRYLFGLEKALTPGSIDRPASLYISMGSGDMEEEQSKGILSAFEKQVQDNRYPGLKFKAAEYSNFGHYDAAIPGLVKGLSFILKK